MGGMPAPEAAPPMPEGMPPLNMYQGGIVQRFSDGSDEDAVTRAEPDASSYPPELVSQAQRETLKFISQRPMAVPTLQQAMANRMPVYKELLGGDSREAAQAQMLFDISGAALGFASNRGPQGEVLKGPTLSRLSGATRALPGQIGARAGEVAKQEQAVKLAALQAGEKDIENIRAQNVRLIESQRKAFSDIAKSAGTSLFGKGDWEWNVINRPGLIASWSIGGTTPEQDNLIESAIAQLNTPIVETRTDPVTKESFQVTRRPELPPFLTQAIEARKTLGGDAMRRAPGAAPAAPTAAPGGVSAAPSSGAVASPITSPTPVAAPLPGGLPGATPPAGQTGALPQRGGIWGMSGKITGPAAVTAEVISGIPGLGAPFPEVTQAQNLAKQEVENLIEAFIKSDRAATTEQERLRKLYDIGPKFFDDPAALRDRLIAIDEEIAKEINLAAGQAYNTELPPDTRAKARSFLSAAEKFRTSLGVPVRIYSEEEARKLPIGTQYLWQGRIPAIRRGAPGGKK
jgi:hypothetical protein